MSGMIEDPAVVILDSRALLEAGSDGIAVVDAQGRLLIVKDQPCDLFGYTSAELTCTRVEALVPPNVRSSSDIKKGLDLKPAILGPKELGLDCEQFFDARY